MCPCGCHFTWAKSCDIDDLLATGGTVEAIIKMVERMQASVVGVAFVIELDDLKGREKFKDIPVCALTHFEGE